MLWLPYILVTVCTDRVTVRIPVAYNNCTATLVRLFNSSGYQRLRLQFQNIRSMKHELYHLTLLYITTVVPQLRRSVPGLSPHRHVFDPQLVCVTVTVCQVALALIPASTAVFRRQYSLHTLLHLYSAVTRRVGRRLGTFKQTNPVSDIGEALISEVLYFLCLK